MHSFISLSVIHSCQNGEQDLETHIGPANKKNLFKHLTTHFGIAKEHFEFGWLITLCCRRLLSKYPMDQLLTLHSTSCHFSSLYNNDRCHSPRSCAYVRNSLHVYLCAQRVARMTLYAFISLLYNVGMCIVQVFF